MKILIKIIFLFLSIDSFAQIIREAPANVNKKEDTLGKPAANGYILSSTTGKVRSWIAPPTGGTWGAITGTLSSQTDLQGALNAKASLSGTNTFTGNNTFRGYIISNGAGGITTNTAIGFEALNTNTTGNLNTANGVASLYSNTTGASNTANGVASLYSNTTGASNTTNGVASLYSNTTGYENTANGISSLYSNTTGYENTANGISSLYSNTTGFSNTANGIASGYDITTGNNNTLLGKRAGRGITTGSNNTILGANQIDLVNTLSSTVSISDGSGNKRFYSPSTGNVLFGSETDTGEKLQVTGTSKFTGKLTNTDGDIELTDNTKGIILKSADGTRYIIKVANGGILTVTAL